MSAIAGVVLDSSTRPSTTAFSRSGALKAGPKR
jgi:hypothetical protein